MSEPDKVAVTKSEVRDAKSYLRLPYARSLIPAEEGGFFAEILEFPGCFAEGETPNEAFSNLESVAESWIEAALEQGLEIPPPSANETHSGRIALRLPRDLHRQAAHKAQRDGVSLNQCLVTAVAAWVGADNLFERIAHRVEMNFVQQNVQVDTRFLIISGTVPDTPGSGHTFITSTGFYYPLGGWFGIGTSVAMENIMLGGTKNITDLRSGMHGGS